MRPPRITNSRQLSWVISVVAVITLMVISLYPTAWSKARPASSHPLTLTPVTDLAGSSPHVAPVSTESAGAMSIGDIQALTTTHSPGVVIQRTQPVSLTAPHHVTPSVIPSILVFPVMLHGAQDKAFSDLPVMLSSAVASQLSRRAHHGDATFTVMNPIFMYDELREKGLDGLYQKIVSDYREAGQPNEKDLSFLVERLGGKEQPVGWVAFVEADFDLNHMTKPVGIEIPLARLLDRSPKQPNYFIKGQMNVYSLQSGVPLVWSNTASSRITWNAFENFTRSVFDDSDSAMTFKATTTQMAAQMIGSLPEHKLLTRTSVQAQLATPGQSNPAILTPADQETLKRILQN